MQKRKLACLLLLALLGCAALLLALTGTVAPDGDNDTGGWSTTPLWSKVDDDIDAPDGTVIVSPNNPSSPSDDVVFDVTCPGDVGTITEANLRLRAREQGGARNVSLDLKWSATTTTDFSTGNLTTTMTNYASGNQTGLSISKSTCDASTIRANPTTTGGGSPEKAEIDSFNLDIIYTAAAGGTVNRLLITQRRQANVKLRASRRRPRATGDAGE